MANEAPTTTLTKAIINTGVSQLPEMIKTGGKALIRHMQRDPINLGAMDTAVTLFSQAVLPAAATTSANTWARYAAVQSTTHELGPDFGVNLVSQAQSALAEASGFSQTVFIISNLVGAVGLPKVASALHHMRNPTYDIEVGDEAENVVTSLYSAKAVHTQMQALIEQTTQRLEEITFPLFTTNTTEGVDYLVWASSNNADSQNILKFKLLQSITAVSRFGTGSTPITYPIVLNHLSWIVALAVIFGFRLECDGAKLLDKTSNHSGTIKLSQNAAFAEGAEILYDIHALINAETKEGNTESLTLRDVRTQALLNLQQFSTSDIATFRPMFVMAANVTHPETKKDEAITESALRIISILDRLNPDDTLTTIEPPEDHSISEDEDDSFETWQEITMLFMIELVQKLVAGQVLSLGIVVNDAYDYLPGKSALTQIAEKDNDWASYIWRFFGLFVPRLQPDRPFSSIISGQSGVLVPTLLICKTHVDLMNCTLPMTIVPGTLMIRGKRSKMLDQAVDAYPTPLKEDEVAQTRRATCIWRAERPRVSLLGQADPYSYKVYAAEHTLDTYLATLCWMDTISSGSDAAVSALEELGNQNAPDYVCRNVDSTRLNESYEGLTVWLSQASLAGKLLVLKTLDQSGSSMAFPIYISDGETFRTGLQHAHALGCKHILV